ncbi:alpha/beta hydrolase [Glycomyces sp. TRM65418]|nr:alpha/beta hydrolase [Glycomyces sp. TRM65418]
MADALAPHFTAYAVDRRGHGASEDGPEFDFKREQEDIAAVLDLAGPDTILFGHSYGGLITLGLAPWQAPAALILYEPPGPAARSGRRGRHPPYEKLVAEGDYAQALEFCLRNFLRMPDEAIEAFSASPMWAARASMAPTWVHEPRAIDGFGDDLDRFAWITCPTLLVTGELSPPLLLETSQRLQGAMPEARLVHIPGHAHEAYLTAPAVLAEEIRRFIE